MNACVTDATCPLCSVHTMMMMMRMRMILLLLVCLCELFTVNCQSNCLTDEQLAAVLNRLEQQGLVNRDKYCLGTVNGFTVVSTQYTDLYMRYKNCEIVIGNLEVSSSLNLKGCPYSYNFLSTITEVTGIHILFFIIRILHYFLFP